MGDPDHVIANRRLLVGSLALRPTTDIESLVVVVLSVRSAAPGNLEVLLLLANSRINAGSRSSILQDVGELDRHGDLPKLVRTAWTLATTPSDQISGASVTAAISCCLGLGLIGLDDGGHRLAANSRSFGNLLRQSGMQDPLVVGFFGWEGLHQSATAHNVDHISYCQQLFEFRRGHNDAKSVFLH